MLTRWRLLVWLLLSSSCLDTTLPPAPVLGPGTVRATIMTARPGRAEVEPAVGATVTLVGTGQSATADSDGNVLLTGINETRGRLLFALDTDDDGVADQSRMVGLEAVAAGFGRDVNLGPLVLSRNATIVGSVRRGDRDALPTGHGGISAFLPQLPQLSWSGDDGRFELRGAPEGTLVLSFFANGYEPAAVTIDVAAGQEVRVATVVLKANPGASPLGRLIGKAVNAVDGTPMAAVQITAASNGVETLAQTSAEGTFALESLPTGLYGVALTRTGVRPLRLYNVLVAPGVNDLGALALEAGAGAVRLDGGPTVPPQDAGLVDSGTPDAGLPDAGAPDSGTPDAGTPDAGTPDAGTPDAGTPDAGTPDAGEHDAGFDAGVQPVAVTGPAQTVARSSTVRLNGAASTGNFPLRYRWTQLSGPTVTLSSNDLVTSHSPTFVAPGQAAQLEFRLEVFDRDEVVSANLATARVSVSDVPVARFVPDGGLVIGGQTVTMQSLSYDDGGLVLINHDWQLASGSAATLVADGGPTALVTFTPMTPGDPDLLARVELKVTNAVGAVSNTFARDFTVRAGSSNTWSVTATPVNSIAVGEVPPTVNLAATFSLPAGAPTPTVSWACTPTQALVGANTLTPSFIAPRVEGPAVTVTCTVTATGAPPLQPATRSAFVIATFTDALRPTVVSVEEPSFGPWGRTVRFSEPMATASTYGTSCTGGTGPGNLSLPTLGSFALPWPLITPATCGSFTVNGTDFANQSVAPAVNLGGMVGRTIWEGPWLSTTQFDDPRPVLPSLSQVPEGAYEVAGAPLPHAPGLELLASAPGVVYRFPIDARVADAGCSGGCALTETAMPMPWVVGGELRARRAFAAGSSIFTSFKTDGGTAMLERLHDGGFVGPVSSPGWAFSSRSNAQTHLDAVSLDGGAIDRWRWDPVSRSWNRGDRIATGVASIEEATGNERQVVALVGAARTLTVWTYGVWSSVSSQPQWHNFPTPAQLSGAGQMTDIQSAFVHWNSTIHLVAYTRPNGSQALYRLFDEVNEFGNPFVADRTWGSTPTAAINGFDWVARGDLIIGVRAENGSILLSYAPYAAFGSGNFSTAIAGPPRGGPGPHPAALNVDVACEGAHPRLALVDDRLYVTWQERCAPETRWRVAMRVLW